MQEYCERHGYHYIFHKSLMNTERHPSWNKLVMLNECMETHPNYDYYVWIDDDILITNYNISLESFITRFGFDKDDKKTLMVSEDIHVLNLTYPFNCGLLILKPTSKQLLNKIWIMGKVLNHEHTPSWEQETMQFYWTHIDKSEFMVIPHKIIQSIYKTSWLPETHVWSRGDFAAHLAGRSNEERMSILENLIGKIIRD